MIPHSNPLPERRSRDQPRILDRNAQVLGIAASRPSLGEDALEVEVTETLHHRLGLDDGRIEVPRAWVAGIRRDEVRLSVAIEDPAFRARLLDQPGRREPVSPVGHPGDEPREAPAENGSQTFIAADESN